MSEMSEQKTKNTHLVAALYILLLSVLMYMLRQNSIANEEVRRLISHTLATHESAEIPEQNSKKARLTKAAEALVDAARLETDAFTSEELDENLEYLKIYLNKVPQKLDSSTKKLDAEINKLTALTEAKVADNLDKVVQQLDSSNESFGDQINILTQHVAAATSELTALKSLMAEEYKQTQLQRALTLTKSGSFKYFIDGSYQNEKWELVDQDSSELAERIIQSFMQGYGRYLPSDAKVEQQTGNADEDKKMFRDKITQQIRDLIRREPRLVQDSNGWAIHYS
jgi:hypothetical protein